MHPFSRFFPREKITNFEPTSKKSDLCHFKGMGTDASPWTGCCSCVWSHKVEVALASHHLEQDIFMIMRIVGTVPDRRQPAFSWQSESWTHCSSKQRLSWSAHSLPIIRMWPWGQLPWQAVDVGWQDSPHWKKVEDDEYHCNLPLVPLVLQAGEVVPGSALKPSWLALSLENCF